MSKKKGLSLDEKRKKMLEIFHESKDVFQLKDIERIAPKSKGITLQTVKTVLQELVDDGLVQSEKIGVSIYYWSFPGSAIRDLKRKTREFEEKNEEADKRLKILEDKYSKSKEIVHDVEKIDKLQEDIKQLQKKRQDLEKQLLIYKKNDPAILMKKLEESKKIIEAANRWTDNIFSLKTWCKQKFGFEDQQLDKNFGIPEDFDYVIEK